MVYEDFLDPQVRLEDNGGPRHLQLKRRPETAVSERVLPSGLMPTRHEDRHRSRREIGKSRGREAAGANLSATGRDCAAGSDGCRHSHCRTGGRTALPRTDRNSAVVAEGPRAGRHAPDRRGSFEPNVAMSRSVTRPNAFHHQGMRKEPA